MISLMNNAPRFLVIDGYTKQARDELQTGGASLAAELYVDMLTQCGPSGTECDVLFPSDPGAHLPDGSALKNYDGIAWTGCSLCIFSGQSEVQAQIELARTAFGAGIPGFGSCWAAQIAVAAAGGQVALNSNGREMGIARKITLTDAGRGHPLYDGKRAVFDAFTSHDDEITELPPHADRLSGNEFTHVQSVSITREGTEFWGLQYHPEYNLHEMARLTFCRIEKLVKRGFFENREAALEHVVQLETLHKNPDRKDIAWKLAIDEDVMNDDIRWTETRNWINHLVLPCMRK